MIDLAGRIFRKGISLLEQRLHIKINNAVLIIDTEAGEHHFVLKDNDFENLSLASRYFHGELMKLAGKKQFISGLVTCDLCIGSGETIDEAGIIETCSKCKGGGIVARIYNTETAQNEP